MADNKLTNQDKLRWFMMLVSSILFSASVIVKLFQPTTEVNSISTVFVSISGLVLGSTAVNLFKSNGKDQQ
jgi:hypothetical protein